MSFTLQFCCRTRTPDTGMFYATSARLLLSAILSLACVATLCSCAALVPSQRPQLSLHEVHDFGARQVAFSPSGDRLATGGHLGDVLVWSVPAGERLSRLSGHDKPISGLLWVGDRHLVSTDRRGVITLWDTTTGNAVTSRQTDAITSLAWWPGLQRLVTGHADGGLRSFSYPGLEPLAGTNLASRVMSVAVEPREAWLAVSTADRHVRLLGADLQTLDTLESPPGKAFELQFAPDGRQLAGGGWFRIFLWNMATGELLVRNTEHNGAITSLDYSPDGTQMASIGRITDARVRITDTGSGTTDRRLATQPLCGWDVRFSPDGQYVASSSEDGSVFLYNLGIPYRPTLHQGPRGTD